MFWPADPIHLFVHYTISLSSLCKLIWRLWTHKMPVRYILLSVWVRLSTFSVIHYTICGAVCFQFTHFPCDNWENIYICLIIIIKSEVWTITHCLGLGHETMVCSLCVSIFLSKQMLTYCQHQLTNSKLIICSSIIMAVVVADYIPGECPQWHFPRQIISTCNYLFHTWD